MTKENVKEENYEEVSNEYKIWKPSLNDEIEGTIVKRQKSSFGQSYVLEKDDELYLLPNHAILEGLLDRCHIGDRVRIVCTGFQEAKEKGKNKTTLYKVFIKRS
jgi:hypothetical protein